MRGQDHPQAGAKHELALSCAKIGGLNRFGMFRSQAVADREDLLSWRVLNNLLGFQIHDESACLANYQTGIREEDGNCPG